MPHPPTRKKTTGPAASTPPRDKPVLRFRMRITCDDVIAIGPGKISLLEAIESTGSITAAAKSLNMSYRRAWLLLDELNHAMKTPAVDSAKGGTAGGGSALTDAGRQVVVLYRRIEDTAVKACQQDIRKIMALLAR